MRGHNTPRCRIVKENPRWALESVEEPLTNYADPLPLWGFGLPRPRGLARDVRAGLGASSLCAQLL